MLLEAFRRVDGGELPIVGDGPLREAVESAAARDPRIRLLGHRDGEALANAYRDAHVLIVPSLYEPWGLVVHEGLAHGLPVIATDQVGAGDDLIESGMNGYVVPAGSAERSPRRCKRLAEWAPEQWERAAKPIRRDASQPARSTEESRGSSAGARSRSNHRRGRTKQGLRRERDTSSITGVTQ